MTFHPNKVADIVNGGDDGEDGAMAKICPEDGQTYLFGSPGYDPHKWTACYEGGNKRLQKRQFILLLSIPMEKGMQTYENIKSRIKLSSDISALCGASPL